MTTIWKPKDPAEHLVATFHYLDELDDGETIVGAIPTCTLISGTDANPSARPASRAYRALAFPPLAIYRSPPARPLSPAFRRFQFLLRATSLRPPSAHWKSTNDIGSTDTADHTL